MIYLHRTRRSEQDSRALVESFWRALPRERRRAGKAVAASVIDALLRFLPAHQRIHPGASYLKPAPAFPPAPPRHRAGRGLGPGGRVVTVRNANFLAPPANKQAPGPLLAGRLQTQSASAFAIAAADRQA